MKDLVGLVGAARVGQTGNEYALGEPVCRAVGATTAGGQGAVTVQQGDDAVANTNDIDVNLLVDLHAHDAIREIGRCLNATNFDRPRRVDCHGYR